MDLKFLLYEKKERIAYVTINRPEVMNAIHPPAWDELYQVWSDFAADPDVWIAIFTGAGERAFCAGSDLKWRVQAVDERVWRNPVEGGRGNALARCPKPVIAAVNGYAVGGGLEWAMHCDIIVAAEHAKFGLPEGRRGLLADSGGVVKLPRRIPYHLAMGLILTGKLISAQEAYRIGLVNEVVPLADLMPAAERWGAEILECGPLSVRAAKDIVRRTIGFPEESAAGLIEGLYSVRKLRESEDYVEGPKAFNEKRKPCWKGR